MKIGDKVYTATDDGSIGNFILTIEKWTVIAVDNQSVSLSRKSWFGNKVVAKPLAAVSISPHQAAIAILDNIATGGCAHLPFAVYYSTGD